VSVDLRAAYTAITAGAAKHASFGGPDQVNVFVRGNDPSRGIIGSEDREILDLSANIDIETSIGTITSVTGYMDLNQDLFGTASWVAPPGLGEAPESGWFGPIFGPNALPATDPLAITQPFDNYQELFDDFEDVTQDIRLVSPSDQRLRYLVGFEYIHRKASQGLQVG